MNDHISLRRVKIRSDSLPWMNFHIRKTMNKRYNIPKRAKETGSKELWDEYKKLRNEVTKLLREPETHYWRQEFNNKDSSKDFWKLVARITHKKKLNNIGPIADDQGNISLIIKKKLRPWTTVLWQLDQIRRCKSTQYPTLGTYSISTELLLLSPVLI